MQKSTSILLGSLLLLAGLALALMRNDASRRIPPPASTGFTGNSVSESAVAPIVLYCAASNRAVIDAIVQQYTKECGRQVDVQYGPSQTLLTTLQVSGHGDLYLPADSSYIDMAKSKELVQEVFPIAKMHAVVAVAKGNPKNIQSFDDLLKPEIKLVQANPDAAAIGKVVRDELQKQGLWDQLSKNTVAFRMTVTDIANDVALGAADAAIVYEAVLHGNAKVEAVPLKELVGATSDVCLAVARGTVQPPNALHFARYVAASDRGLKQYAANGFEVEKGDQWSAAPELSIFAGSMLRPAIEKTLTEFEQREGVRVNRVYNGCGILVAQMQGGQHPDAYFACDKEFMNKVPDLFPAPVDVSQNELVILVQKGNPHNIKNLKDLGNQGLRVGVGHEKQCAMGWLTQNTLREGGVEQEVMANVMVQSPTGDMLVNQMLAGSLDAAVVYLSNAAGAGEKLDAIRIVGLPCSIATQPFAVAIDSPRAQLASRLFERIQSAESKSTFLAEGFRWSSDLTSTNKHE